MKLTEAERELIVERETARLDKALAEVPRVTAHQDAVRRKMNEWMSAAVVTGWIEPAESGDWAIETFGVSEQDEQMERLRSLVSSSSRGRWCPAGVYTKLARRCTTVMSDTPDEIQDLYPLYRALGATEARRVLIHGLGLGCALRLALASETVEHVDVVEFAPDVLTLVGPYFADDPRVSLIEGDAYAYRFSPRTRWDVAWHDIWDDISADNDFATLHRRYGRRVSWQGSWCREHALQARRVWERENAWWRS